MDGSGVSIRTFTRMADAQSESAKRLRTDHNGHHVNGDANGETDGNVSLDDRLANMVEWGDIPKPKNW